MQHLQTITSQSTGRESTLRKVQLTDTHGNVDITIWGDQTASPVKAGDTVAISHLTSPKKFNQKLSLQTTGFTSINLIARVPEHATEIIIGYKYSNNTFTVISEDCTEYTITEDLLQPLFPTETSLKDSLQEHLPIHLQIQLQGKTIINATLADPHPGL